jgi:hypothetical protein
MEDAGMKLSEILRAGKANIERYGWCQGDELAIHGGHNGPCCAATAISCQYQLFVDRNSAKLGDAAIEALKKAADIDLNIGIATWNDAPERTEAEVLAAYDKAITAAEAQETS